MNMEKEQTKSATSVAPDQEDDDVLLSVKDLVVHYVLKDETVEAVNGISFTIRKGQTLGLVGETGSGKTSTALAIMNLIQSPPGVIESGDIIVNGKDMLTMTSKQLEKVRGKDVSMIFQDPMTALNPVMTVGQQIAESIMYHENLSASESLEKAVGILELVGISAARASQFPHQFSGGMKQRVVIAIALACNPQILIADEPTTALDVTIQAQVLDIIQELKEKLGTALIMITHDLGVVAKTCNIVAVMYAGRIIEYGTLEDIFNEPLHPYTEGLFNSLPTISDRRAELIPIPGLTPDPTRLPPGCAFEPRCRYAVDKCKEPCTTHTVSDTHSLMCSRYDEPGFRIEMKRGEKREEQGERVPDVSHLLRGAAGAKFLEVRKLKKYFTYKAGTIHAVDDVTFSINEGETLGLVGESGCGKTTVGRSILRLIEPTSGEVVLNGRNILAMGRRELNRARKDFQIVFQDPFSSLNPRRTVFETIAEPIKAQNIIPGATKAQIEHRVMELMSTVGLAERLINTFPHELDGGRRQRIGIARALAVEPKFIVCDEPVSALDVSIQAQILNLLKELQRTRGLTFLFVTHDLAVANHFSNDIIVMYLGQEVEKAPSDELFANPMHPYTKALLSAVLVPEAGANKERVQLRGELSAPYDPPDECRFARRCNYYTKECDKGNPPYVEITPDHWVACHCIGPDRNELELQVH